MVFIVNKETAQYNCFADEATMRKFKKLYPAAYRKCKDEAECLRLIQKLKECTLVT